MKIKIATEADVDNIVTLHHNSFGKNHFSATFSPKMLRSYFKKLLMLNEHSYVMYNDSENVLLGYTIAGFNTEKAVNEFISENKIRIIASLVQNPRFIPEKLEELGRKIFKRKTVKKAKCRLYLIALNEKFKGKGYGKSLLDHLEQSLFKSGIKLYGLSVRKENLSAINFYEKNGYVREFENSKSIYYLKKLN